MSKPCFRMATIGVAFMQQHEDTAASQFETIVAALTAILKCVGRPKFLDSLFHLWSGLTHSLILMEHMFSQNRRYKPTRLLPFLAKICR